MYGINQRCIYISFHFFVLWCHAQGENHPSPNFNQYVRTQGAVTDQLSRRQIRVPALQPHQREACPNSGQKGHRHS
ncbi:hypothetical protein INR49_028024 [Caranx melampygus]|nr:hypothetical protein INR49_028024 [Caranx melampygus]